MMITNKSARIFDVVCARQMIVYLLYEYQFQVLEICELMSLSSNTVYHSINVARNKLQNKSYVAFKEKYQLIKQNFNNQ